MEHNTRKPIIFLAFANDRDDRTHYLRNLPDEARQVREVLEAAQDHNLCEVVVRQNATLEDILGVFRDPKYRNHIALFHFGGHANGYQLLLETAEGKPVAAYAEGLAAFLGQQTGLEVVFLNGCSTQSQVQELLNAEVSVVIATSQAIDDKVAAEFATNFYTAFANGANIRTAFAEAEAAAHTKHGKEPRNLYLVGVQPEVADRRPWELHLRPGAETMAQWNLPEAVNDPLFGLPPLPKLDLPESPYRYLDWYRREDAELFFGRSNDIRDLYSRIIAVDSPPIILLYGQSGVGKSSLLAAGLLPRLEKSYAQVYLRRDQSKGLLGTLTSSPSPLSSNEPRLGWRALEARTGKPLLIVLDQVEEFFTRPNPDLPEEMKDFLASLKEAFGNPEQRPQGKLLLSFRKEWLAEVEKQLAELKLPRAKVFLERLDKRGIIDVVTGPAQVERLRQHYDLKVDEQLPELIADRLLEDSGAAIAPTLQILLKRLWDLAKAENYDHPVFLLELYEQIRRDGLGLMDFLNKQMDELHKIQAAAVDSGLSIDLLAFHTTLYGTAEQHKLSEVQSAYHHQDTTIPVLLDHFQKLFLLTDTVKNQPDSEPETRLAHDTLAPLVRARYESSDAPGQRARRILESRVPKVNGNAGNNAPLEPLADADLALVEAGAAGMRAWDNPEQQLVDHSRTERKRRATRRWLIRGAYLVSVLVIATALGFASLRSTQAKISESQWLANEALQRLEVDPVQAVSMSLAALPSPTNMRPYVPQAEFSLYQTLRSNLEQEYRKVADPTLTEDQVAFADDQIAVGKDELLLVPFSHSEAEDRHLAQYEKKLTAVAWNHSKKALLAWNAETLQVWLGSGQPFEPELKHDVPFAGAQWEPGSNRIAVSQGKSLWLWSYDTEMLTEIYTSTRSVDTIRWSPAGKWLAVWDGAAYALALVNTQDSRPHILRLETPLDVSIEDVGWSTDGQHLVATFEDATALIWPLESPQEPTKVILESEPSGLQYRIEFVDDDNFVTWTTGPGHRAQLWSVRGKPTHPLHEFGRELDDLQDVRLSPDQPWLLTLLGDGVIRGWNLETGAQLFDLQGHTLPILSIDWLDQSRYLATSSSDGTARVWDTSTEEELVILRGHTGTDSSPGVRADLWVHWRDRQNLFTYGEDGTLRLWTLFDDQGHPLCEEMGHCYRYSQLFPKAETKIATASWLFTDTVLATDYSGNSWTWQLSNPDDERSDKVDGPMHQAGQEPIVSWSPSGEWVFRYKDKGAGTLWQFSTQISVLVPGPISFAKWLDNGLLLGQPSGDASLFSEESGSFIRLSQPGGHERGITAAHVHNDRLATGDQKGVIAVWKYKDVNNQEASLQFTATLDSSSVNPWGVTQLKWSPDGTHLLSKYSQLNGDNIVRLWEVANDGMQTLEPEWPNVRAVAFSLDGKFIAVADLRYFRTYDIQKKAESIRVFGHSGLINGVEWIDAQQWPNQNLAGSLVSGLLARLPSERWIPPSTRSLLLTWSGDGTLGIWQWGGIKNPVVEIARISNAHGLNSYALNSDGSRLLTVDDNGVLRMWHMWLNNPEELRSVAEKSIQHRLNQ